MPASDEDEEKWLTDLARRCRRGIEVFDWSREAPKRKLERLVHVTRPRHIPLRVQVRNRSKLQFVHKNCFAGSAMVRRTAQLQLYSISAHVERDD